MSPAAAIAASASAWMSAMRSVIRAPSYGSARTARSSPPSPRSATRCAIGMCATWSLARRPRPAARHARSRPAASSFFGAGPVISETGSPKIVQGFAGAGHERDLDAREVADVGARERAPRTPRPSTRAPPWGCTGPRCRPERHARRAERLRRAQHRPDVARDRERRAGTRTAAGRRRRPPLLVHRQRPRARAQARGARQRARARPRCRQDRCPPPHTARWRSSRSRRPNPADPHPRRRTARRARASAGAGGACGSP